MIKFHESMGQGRDYTPAFLAFETSYRLLIRYEKWMEGQTDKPKVICPFNIFMVGDINHSIMPYINHSIMPYKGGFDI